MAIGKGMGGRLVSSKHIRDVVDEFFANKLRDKRLTRGIVKGSSALDGSVGSRMPSSTAADELAIRRSNALDGANQDVLTSRSPAEKQNAKKRVEDLVDEHAGRSKKGMFGTNMGDQIRETDAELYQRFLDRETNFVGHRGARVGKQNAFEGRDPRFNPSHETRNQAKPAYIHGTGQWYDNPANNVSTMPTLSIPTTNSTLDTGFGSYDRISDNRQRMTNAAILLDETDY